MKKLIFVIISFFISFPTLAAPDSNTSSQENFIIAKVNNKAITNSELLDRYRFVITSAKIKISDVAERKLLTAQVLDKMIDEELIRQDAAVLKIEVTPEEMRESIDIIALQQKKNATQLKIFFIKNNLSFDNYLKQVEAEILWSKIVSEFLRAKVKVTDFEIKEFFEQHKFNTDIKKFLIAEILIGDSKNGEQLALKLVEELKQGADFKNVVRQFSASLSAENNGEIGWVSASDIDPKIYAAISKLKKDGYSDPVKLSDGFHIFKLLDAKSETKIADQDLAAARNAIYAKKLQSLAKGYSMDLRKRAYVEIVQ